MAVFQHASREPELLARLALRSIRAYQLMFSAFLPGSCRFVPSCSEYAADAIRTHGVSRGGWLAVRRLSKCHPFGPAGHDPVPGRLP